MLKCKSKSGSIYQKENGKWKRISNGEIKRLSKYTFYVSSKFFQGYKLFLDRDNCWDRQITGLFLEEVKEQKEDYRSGIIVSLFGSPSKDKIKVGSSNLVDVIEN